MTPTSRNATPNGPKPTHTTPVQFAAVAIEEAEYAVLDAVLADVLDVHGGRHLAGDRRTRQERKIVLTCPLARDGER